VVRNGSSRCGVAVSRYGEVVNRLVDAGGKEVSWRHASSLSNCRHRGGIKVALLGLNEGFLVGQKREKRSEPLDLTKERFSSRARLKMQWELIAQEMLRVGRAGRPRLRCLAQFGLQSEAARK